VTQDHWGGRSRGGHGFPSAGGHTSVVAKRRWRTLAKTCRPGHRVPRKSSRQCFGFAEFSRRAGDFAMVMALAVLEIEEDVIASACIGVGGAEAIPRRLAAAEAVLPGRGGLPRRGSGRCGGD
jgi:hypothetical protein